MSSLIFLRATVRPEDFTLALYTTPYVPSPIFSNLSKESILSSSPAAMTVCVCVEEWLSVHTHTHTNVHSGSTMETAKDLVAMLQATNAALIQAADAFRASCL